MAGISITSANTSINLTIPGVFSSGVLLQQFDTEDIIDPEPQELTESSVGADGFVVGGYVFNLSNFRITFQPNSNSIPVFYQWKAAQDSETDIIPASIKIITPSLGLDVDLTDVLCKSLPFLPPMKKVARSLTVAMTANPLWQTTST
jgi:hypothetical protein